MNESRKELYKNLESSRESKLIVFITGDRPGLETQIHPEVIDNFVHHLDLIGVTQKITLFLYTRGGNTLASWSIVNLIRQFCKHLEVIVPSKAQSSGTLICLGADNIIMTKQATLGPIDPSVNSPLNPQVQIVGAGPPARYPVSVEAINGYIEFAKEALGEKANGGMDSVINQLASQVHPLVLGNAYRSRDQIRMLARRLVERQLRDNNKIDNVLNFLCSESGSHDYTIYRREARDKLGLRIEKPNDSGYHLIKKIYDDIAKELELRSIYDPKVLLANGPKESYEFRRGLVESLQGGCHVFLSKGTLEVQQIVANGVQQIGIRDSRTFEGWQHEN